jgi:hypothetical protein
MPLILQRGEALADVPPVMGTPARALFVGANRQRFQLVRNSLAEKLTFDFAIGSSIAIGIVQNKGPYTIIIVDAHDKIDDREVFLQRLQEICPETPRIVLLPNEDFAEACILAARARAYRILPSDAATSEIELAVDHALEETEARLRQQEFLQETLTGSVKMLVDILALVSPTVFRRATRVATYAKKAATLLRLPHVWRLELAAMLYRIGCVTMPDEATEAFFSGRDLSPQQVRMVAALPQVTAVMLAQIPHLAPIIRVIEGSQSAWHARARMELLGESDFEAALAQVLRVALRFDGDLVRGLTQQESTAAMKVKGGFNPDIVAAFAEIDLGFDGWESRLLRTDQLGPDMVLGEDVVTLTGVLLVGKGEEVTSAVLERLLSVARSAAGVREPFSVLVRAANAQANVEDGRFS